MEIYLVRLLSSIFSRFYFKGAYRLASLIYSYQRNFWQHGVWIKKKYLDAKYDLEINLFSKDLIDHKILFTGSYERDTNLILEKHVRSGDWVLEAGANSGTETLLISRLVGNSGKVLAFEPVPHVLEKLKSNLRLNSISNTMTMPVAVGEKTDEVSFFIYPQEHPNQGMGSKTIGSSGLQKLTINQSTLDSLYLELHIQRFDFLKMDVQGAELDILKGGQKCIRLNQPKIFLEAADGWSNINDIFNYLELLNYSVFLIENDHLEKLELPRLKMGNWLALPNLKNETNHSKS